jgi:hypothetical protein
MYTRLRVYWHPYLQLVALKAHVSQRKVPQLRRQRPLLSTSVRQAQGSILSWSNTQRKTLTKNKVGALEEAAVGKGRLALNHSYGGRRTLTVNALELSNMLLKLARFPNSGGIVPLQIKKKKKTKSKQIRKCLRAKPTRQKRQSAQYSGAAHGHGDGRDTMSPFWDREAKLW